MPGSASLPVGTFIERAQDVLDELQLALEHHYVPGIRDGRDGLALLASVQVIGAHLVPGFNDWHRRFVQYVQSHPRSMPLDPQDIQRLGDALRPLYPHP